MIVRWCNGNTADFGSAFPGSNPGRTTQPSRALAKAGFFISGPRFRRISEMLEQ